MGMETDETAKLESAADKDRERGEDPAGDKPRPLLSKEARGKLRDLERRDWWLWAAAVVVILLLTVAVIAVSFPVLLRRDFSFLEFSFEQALRSMVGLVFIFNCYVVYQQFLIKRLRVELSEKMAQAAMMETRSKQFEDLAVLDPLSGLHNRRYAEERLAAEVARAHRHGLPLTVVVLDLDRFKQINDRYGHAAGDQALREFARQLKRATRATDVVARVGGDEFVLLLPDCSEEQVNRVLARLGPMEFLAAGETVPVFSSLGWACLQPGEKPAQLLERADRALYANKTCAAGNPIAAAKAG